MNACTLQLISRAGLAAFITWSTKVVSAPPDWLNWRE